MAGIGNLTIDLAANITRFESALTRAEHLADKRATAIQRTFSRLAGGIGVALGSVGFVRLIDQSLDFADNLGKTADKLGLTTDALQEYRFAAEQTGVAQSALDVGIQRFTRRLGEAQQGGGVLAKVMADVGINLKYADGTFKDTNVVLGEYADKIKGTANSQQQLLLAFKAFDTEGAALVNLMRLGSDGIQKFRDEAQSLGIVMDEDLIRNSEKANDQLNIMSKVLKVSLTSAAVSLAPKITEIGEAFANLVKGDIQKLPEWAKNTATAFIYMNEGFTKTGQTIGAVAASLTLLLDEPSKISIVWQQLAKDFDAAGKSTEDFLARMNNVDEGIKLVTNQNLTGDELVQRIESITSLIEQKRAQLTESLSAEGDPNSMLRGVLPSPEVLQADIERLTELLNTWDAMLGERNAAALVANEAERKNFFTGLTEGEMEYEFAQAVKAFDDLDKEYADAQKALTEHNIREGKKRQQAEQDTADFIQNTRSSSIQNGIALLRVFGRESKSAAIAALAIEKSLAIATAVAGTQAAMAKSRIIDPTGGLAAKIAVEGALNVATIAALGLAQAASINSSGTGSGPTGTLNDPFAVDTNPFNTPIAQTGTRGTITINVNGVVTPEIMQDLIIPAIQDAANDKDVILFNNDSRQALELTQ